MLCSRWSQLTVHVQWEVGDVAPVVRLTWNRLSHALNDDIFSLKKERMTMFSCHTSTTYEKQEANVHKTTCVPSFSKIYQICISFQHIILKTQNTSVCKYLEANGHQGWVLEFRA